MLFAVMYVAFAIRAIHRIAKAKPADVPWSRIVFGPDSPVPNGRDVRDLLGMLRWFFGLGSKPGFERWTYWEKFNYWGMVAILGFVGVSGMIVWWPNLFARFMSGATLNWAHMTHSQVSLVATGGLLAIYYFNMHFRPEKFPMDLSFLTGLVHEEHLQRARPDFLERMRQQGKLDRLRIVQPSRKFLWAITIGGYVAHLVGLALVATIILASLGE